MAPVFSGVKSVLGPFAEPLDIFGGKSFLQVLTDPIEAIVKLNEKCGTDVPTTFVGLAEEYGSVSPGWASAVSVMADIVTIANAIDKITLPTSGDPLVIEFGSFTVQGGQSDGSLSAPAADEENSGLDSWIAQIQMKLGTENNPQSGLTEFTTCAETGVFGFPFLSEPGQIFNLLLGIPVNLFTFNPEPIGFSFPFPELGFRFPFPATMIKLSLGGEVKFSLDLAFGFDSYGLQVFVQNNYANVFDILRGFYVSDTAAADGTGGDVPEIVFSVGITGKVALDAWVASAGVATSLIAEIGLDLDDPFPEPNGAGKIRASELWYNLKEGYQFFRYALGFPEVAAWALSPIGLFNSHGELRVELYVFASLLGIDWEWPAPPPRVDPVDL